MNVLSCFDGMSCGQIALERAGIQVDNYFASEIDKYAIKVTQSHYPNTIQLGDIQNWKEWGLPKIDLLIAGSPCQGFSNAGKGFNFDDPRSKLFFVYVVILKNLIDKNHQLIFLLENVKMKKEWRDIITEFMRVEPIEINSALVSAQNRKRLYWTNIHNILQPSDRQIYLKDIIENGMDYIKTDKKFHIKNLQDKASTLTGGAHNGGNNLDMDLLVFGAALRNQITKRGTEFQLNVRKDKKSNCVVPSYPHKLNGAVIKTIGHGYIKESVSEVDKYPSLCAQSPDSKHLIQVRTKSKTVRVSGLGSPMGSKQEWDLISKEDYRRLSVVECERLQTLPDGYTDGVSNSQRYKMIGNGWTVDVIVHILKHITTTEIESF